MLVREKQKLFWLIVARCLTASLDLAGVLAVGYLGTSAAMFIAGGSDYSRTFKILGFAIPAANIRLLPFILTITLALFVGKAILAIVFTKVTATLLAVIEARAARHITENILGQDIDFASSVPKEEVLFATTIGASSAFSGMLNNLSTLFSEGFLFLGLVFTFFVVDPVSTISVIAYFGLIAFLIQYFTGSRLAKQSQIIVANSLSANAALNDLEAALRELAVLGKRRIYFEKIQISRNKSAKALGSQVYLAGMPRYIIDSAVLIGVMGFGGVKLLTGDLQDSVATLAVFFTGSMRLVAAMLPWQAALVGIKTNIPQAKTAHKFLSSGDSKPSFRAEMIGTSHSPGAVKVQFENVTYQYPSGAEPAVSNVSFTIGPGKIAAFIGESGSGKSTIADLMMGLLTPKSGQITLNDQAAFSLVGVNPGGLAYVPQSPGAISGTIAGNISVGDEIPDVDNLKNAVIKSHLGKLLESLPLGEYTDLGAAKDGFSGGQLQRIGLARALYHNPGLLVMDEATSALDAESEHEIGLAIAELRGKVTVVLIAHRLASVQYADVVFLTAGGRIVDQGTFREIVMRNPQVSRSVELMAVDLESET